MLSLNVMPSLASGGYERQNPCAPLLELYTIIGIGKGRAGMSSLKEVIAVAHEQQNKENNQPVVRKSAIFPHTSASHHQHRRSFIEQPRHTLEDWPQEMQENVSTTTPTVVRAREREREEKKPGAS
jgi:hypothetical protein